MTTRLRTRIPLKALTSNPSGIGVMEPPALALEPSDEIVFVGPFNQRTKSHFRLVNHSTFARMAYKVKSDVPKHRIVVNPGKGVIEPRQTVQVIVIMMPSLSHQMGTTQGRKAATVDTRPRHHLMVQSVEVPRNSVDLNAIWDIVPRRMLKVAYLQIVYTLGNETNVVGALNRKIGFFNGNSGGGEIEWAANKGHGNFRANTAAAGVGGKFGWNGVVKKATNNNWLMSQQKKAGAGWGNENQAGIANGASSNWANTAQTLAVTADNGWSNGNDEAPATTHQWGMSDDNTAAAATDGSGGWGNDAAPVSAAANGWGNDDVGGQQNDLIAENDEAGVQNEAGGWGNDDAGATEAAPSGGGDTWGNDNVNTEVVQEQAVEDNPWGEDNGQVATIQDNGGWMNNAVSSVVPAVQGSAWGVAEVVPVRQDQQQPRQRLSLGGRTNSDLNMGNVVVMSRALKDILVGFCVVLILGIIIGRCF